MSDRGLAKVKRTFHVLKTLGGCGGTIMARALAANGALVLSEVNPRSANIFNCALNPLVQMLHFHSALLPDSWRQVDIHTLGAPHVFGAFVAALTDDLLQPLVIRDYSYVDYIGTPFVWPRPVQACLATALEPFGDIRAALVVRHPVDCLHSLLTHPPLASVLTPEDFVAGHLAFYEDNAGTPCFRYEDFLAAPERVTEAMCAALGIPVQTDWRGNLAATSVSTGDQRAVKSDSIAAPAHRHDTELAARLAAVEGYDRLLAFGHYGERSAPSSSDVGLPGEDCRAREHRQDAPAAQYA